MGGPGDQAPELCVVIEELSTQIQTCRLCVENPMGHPLPHEPRPVCVLSKRAAIQIIGQAPGTRVHASGKPFTDPSGNRLRTWLGVDETTFYDPDNFAITPMGFCFPGLNAKGGDLPPRRECSPHWHDSITRAMPQIRLRLLIGLHAQKFYLGTHAASSMTETVKNWQTLITRNTHDGVVEFPIPHPSWRNNMWLKTNPWFESDALPTLRTIVHEHISKS